MIHNTDIITSAKKLFNRPADTSYLEEWAKLLAQHPEKAEDTKEAPYVVFRLGNEWFTLSALCFVEISALGTINTIPHKGDSIILGVVNLRGQLRICFSLHHLLNIENKEFYSKEVEKIYHTRLIAISHQQFVWTFPVDEVESVYQLDQSMIINVPVNVSHSRDNYFKGIIHINNNRVYILDEEMLFTTLSKRAV